MLSPIAIGRIESFKRTVGGEGGSSLRKIIDGMLRQVIIMV
jgi:hypothetical protein